MALLMETTVLSFLKAYPEFILATIVFLLLPLFLQKREFSLNWPIVGRLPYILSNIHKLHDLCTHMLRKNGMTFVFKVPIMGEDILMTCDPENVNHVFNINFLNYPKGDDFKMTFDVLGNGIFNSDEQSWKIQRNLAHGFVISSRFKSFMAEATRDKVRLSLLPFLEHICGRGDTIDFQDMFMRFTFDWTCTLVFGSDQASLTPTLSNVPFAKAFDNIEEVLIYRHVVPKTWWKLMRWLNIGKERKFSMAREVLRLSIAEFVSNTRRRRREAERRGDVRGGMDLLSYYMDHIDKNGGDEEDKDKFLHDTTLSLMVAGRDATSAALSWFFWLLSKNPSVKTRILEELESCVGRRHVKEEELGGDLSSHVVLDQSDVDKLVYLHAAFSETLRLFPPVPFESKGVVNPDVLPSGAAVHRRTRLLFSLYAMGRMKSIWGEDCREFKPERWISDRGTLRHEPSYKFLSFNAGPRTCLGKNIAFSLMKTTAAAILYNFEVEVLEKQVVVPKISVIMHMKNGIMVKIRRRKRLEV